MKRINLPAGGFCLLTAYCLVFISFRTEPPVNMLGTFAAGSYWSVGTLLFIAHCAKKYG